jgi:thymidylate kinase
MITILEGPDGAGKTTLGKDHVFKDHAYVHLGPPTALGAFHDCVDAIAARRRRRHVLFDRLHLGERVYGPVFRGRDTLGPARQRLLDRVLLSRQAVVVLCLPAVERCLESFRARKETEMLDREDQLREVHAAYRGNHDLYQHLPYVHFNYVDDSPARLRDRVEHARPAYNGGPGVGHFAPGNVLIVGEQVNARARFPFVDDRGCALWLAERLDEKGVSESELYWVNALDPDGEWTDPDFVDGLEPRKIVALGKVAETWCRENGLAHTGVIHPQCHKRFFYHQPYPLLQELAA